MNPQKVSILFGTQTGNSEDIAERIERQLTRMHLKSYVQSLGDYPITRLLEDEVVLFICSTTGDGEFPDNMRLFWRFLLRKNLPNNSLKHLNFCVFGLGDSSYEKFNVVAKKLNKRLLQLGATEILPLTLADDQHELGYDAALDPWLLKLKQTVASFYDVSIPYITNDIPLPSKYMVKFLAEDAELSERKTDVIQKHDYPIATLKATERITSADHFQEVNLVQFNINSTIQYDPGDVAVLWPENPTAEVKEFLSLLNVPVDVKFILVATDPDRPLPIITPYPCTVREFATNYLDILSVPRRSFFELLQHFSEDETEKEKLLEFITAEGQEELYDYCNRPRRTILEVLQDFPYTTPNVPFNYFIDMIPAIRPRSYSIASSLVAHPSEFQLLIAVVKYKTRLQKPRRGLCSNWLANLPVGTKIPFYIKKGSITLPESNNPIIMVGPGTGCAPFRAFCEFRASKEVSNNYLFFGSRYKNKDFLCSETWNELCGKNMLTLFTAFSRDQEDKIYVQHRITEYGALMWELIHNQGAYIFIAGNAKQMPQGVKESFLTVMEKEGGLDNNEKTKYLQILENKKRYQVETWG